MFSINNLTLKTHFVNHKSKYWSLWWLRHSFNIAQTKHNSNQFFFLSLQGVLCPTGCDLKKTIQKQERNVRPTVDQLKRSVDDLTQSTNSVYGYVLDMTTEAAQRQRVSEGNTSQESIETFVDLKVVYQTKIILDQCSCSSTGNAEDMGLIHNLIKYIH